MTLVKYECIALNRVVARVVCKTHLIIKKSITWSSLYHSKTAFNYIYEYAHLIRKENNNSSHYSLSNYVLKKKVCLTYNQSYKWKRNHIFHVFGKINSTLSIVKKTNNV